LSSALDGLAVPLHPGAARFYREVGALKDARVEPQPPAEKDDAPAQ
jgi:hypothetical protein